MSYDSTIWLSPNADSKWMRFCFSWILVSSAIIIQSRSNIIIRILSTTGNSFLCLFILRSANHRHLSLTFCFHYFLKSNRVMMIVPAFFFMFHYDLEKFFILLWPILFFPQVTATASFWNVQFGHLVKCYSTMDNYLSHVSVYIFSSWLSQYYFQLY